MRGLAILIVCVFAACCAPLDNRDFKDARPDNGGWQDWLGVTRAGRPFSYSSYGRLPPTFGKISEYLGGCNPLENDDLQPGHISACKEYRHGDFNTTGGEEWSVDCSEGTCVLSRPPGTYHPIKIRVTAEGIVGVCVRGRPDDAMVLAMDDRKWELGKHRDFSRFEQCITSAQVSEFSTAFHVGAKIRVTVQPSVAIPDTVSDDVIGPAYPDAVRLARYFLSLRQPATP